MGRTGDPREWRAKNGNLLLDDLPPDALELMNDPRVQAMHDPLPGFSATTVALQPAEPVSVESGYWMAKTSYKVRPESGARWVNEPKTGWGPGWGLGFDDITERPRIEQAKKAPSVCFISGCTNVFSSRHPTWWSCWSERRPEASRHYRSTGSSMTVKRLTVMCSSM